MSRAIYGFGCGLGKLEAHIKPSDRTVHCVVHPDESEPLAENIDFIDIILTGSWEDFMSIIIE